MTKLISATIIVIACVTSSLSANAATVGFSFSDDPSLTNFYGRNHYNSTVTGEVYGVGTGAVSTPTGVLFTSDVSWLGLSSNFNYTFDLVWQNSLSVNSITNLISGGLSANFNGRQLRLNTAGELGELFVSWVFWNGTGPLLGSGSRSTIDGSVFVQSSNSGSTSVPEPTTIALMGLGFAGMAARRLKSV